MKVFSANQHADFSVYFVLFSYTVMAQTVNQFNYSKQHNKQNRQQS